MVYKRFTHKKILISLLLVSFFSFSGSAHANILTNVQSGTVDLIRLINRIPFVQKVKNDFCAQYFLAVQNNTWKQSEFRVDFGKTICGQAVNILTSTAEKFVPAAAAIKKVDQNPVFPVQNKINPISATSTLPAPLIDNSVSDGSVLKSGEIIYWTNIERSKNDITLVSLSENSILSKIASERVADMFAKEYFEHVSPTGDNVSKNAARDGYKYITIGENIAFGNFGSSRELVVAWMNSPGHRANILNKNYTQIGVAATEGMFKGEKVWIAAQIFGRPLSDCKMPDPSIKTSITQYTNTANGLSTKLQQIKTELNTNDPQTYNAKVAEYNSVAQTFNDLITKIKTITVDYNKAIEDFNACIKTV